jgi:hypothetical protein
MHVYKHMHKADEGRNSRTSKSELGLAPLNESSHSPDACVLSVYICIYVYMYVNTSVYMYEYVYVCVCVCVCVCAPTLLTCTYIQLSVS